MRLFLASPTDVLAERKSAERIVAHVTRELSALNVSLVLLTDKDDATPGMGRPEGRVLPLVERCDIFIGILWSRFGTPTGASNAGIFQSGTEEEFYAAWNRWKANGANDLCLPRILMYFCSRRVNPSQVDPVQLQKVKEFRSRFSPQGQHPGLVADYSSRREFEERLHSHLVDVVFALAGGSARAQVASDFVAIDPDEWRDFFSTAQTLKLMVMYSRTWRNTYWNQLRGIVERGGRLEVVLPSLSPNNAAIPLMADRCGVAADGLRNCVAETAAELQRLDQGRDSVEIRYTRRYYTHAFYLTQEGGYVALYSYSSGRWPTPAIRLGRGDLLAIQLAEFDSVFDISNKDMYA